MSLSAIKKFIRQCAIFSFEPDRKEKGFFINGNVKRNVASDRPQTNGSRKPAEDALFFLMRHQYCSRYRIYTAASSEPWVSMNKFPTDGHKAPKERHSGLVAGWRSSQAKA